MSRWLGSVSGGALIVSVAALAAPLPAFAASVTISTTNTAQQTVNGTAGDTLTVTSSGKVSTTADPAVKVTSGTTTTAITNSGTVETVNAGGAGPRAIRLVTPGSEFHLTITNNQAAVIQAHGDAIQAQGDIAVGSVSIINSGTIQSTGTGPNDNGQGIDFNKITSSTATVTITNNATGVISAFDADAIRAGNGNTINNFGQIISNFVVSIGEPNGAGSGNDGIDFQSTNRGTVNNFAGGLISGARHGITGDLGQTINNSGTIIGNDGSGINIDTTSNADVTTVTNHGTIIGTAKSADGDGIDVDRVLNLTNDGTIKALGIAPGVEINEALAIGGGTINNLAGGLIYSDQRAITVDDSNLSNAFAAVTINNVGTIWGANGEAIKITSILNNTLINSGTIIGSVAMGSGDDTVNIRAGSRIVGLVDGGANTVVGDTLKYDKVGLTAAKMAALQAGQTVNIGGTLYTGFENFTGSTTRSFSSYAPNGATSGIAALLDNGSTTQSASLATQALIDQVASASDVGAALAQLTPTAFQGFTTVGFNNAFQTTQTVDQRLSNVRQGGFAFDVSGFNTVAAMLNNDRTRPLTPAPYDPSNGGDIASAYAFAPAIGQNPAFAAMARAAGDGANVYKAPRLVQGDSPWGMFLYGNAIFARQGASANSPQSRFTATGVTGGIDRQITPNLVVGLLGGLTRTNADLDTLGSTSRINTWLLGAYGSYYRQNWFANGAFIYGRNSYDNNRIALGTSNTSNTKGNQFAALASVGADFNYGRWIVTPELGAQYTTVRVDGFTETGIAALVVAADQADSLRSSLGSRFQYQWASAWGPMTPELRASWQHEFLDKQRDVRASFVDQSLPGTFSTTTAGAGRDFGVLGTGLTARMAERTQLSLGYDFKFGEHDFSAHQISGRLRHVF